jgi:large subunit ribosomal protein L35
MPKQKQKTHKGIKARVRVTRTGKVVRCRAGTSHLLSGKSGKRKRHLSRPTLVHGRFARTYRQRLTSL